MVTYSSLREKFFDKGYVWEFHCFIGVMPIFDPSCYILASISREQALENWKKAIEKVYKKEWDYWNTWIDYQKHK